MNIDDSEEIPISTTVDYAKIIEDKINKSLD